MVVIDTGDDHRVDLDVDARLGGALNALKLVFSKDPGCGVAHLHVFKYVGMDLFYNGHSQQNRGILFHGF
jgi:hypothetical protein